MAAEKPNENLRPGYDALKKEYPNVKAPDFESLNSITQYNAQMDLLNAAAKKAENTFDSILKTVKETTKELVKHSKEYNFAINSISSIRSMSSKLLEDKKGTSILDQKSLFANKTNLSIERQRLTNLVNQHKITDAQYKKSVKQIDTLNEYNRRRLEQENEINKSIGISSALYGKLNSFIGMSGEKMELVNKRMRASAEGGAGGFKTLMSGGAEYLNQLGEQADSIELIQKGWEKVYEKFKELDKVAVNFARTTSMTREEAWQTLDTFNRYTKTQEKLTDTSQNFLESNTKINNQLGIGATLSKERLSQYSQLSKMAQFDEETMQSLVVSSALNNTSIEASTKERFKGFAVVQRTYGVQLNERALLKEMAKLSATTRLNYMGQEQALAKAAAQAKMMGTDLAKMDSVANSLMDFEGSIQKQMEAEVLTGQTLNLERARYFALTNDINGVMTELNAQGITAEKFSKMNRIQQSAIAESMGMQKEEMASMLVEQKSIMAMGADSYKKKKEQYLLDVRALGVAEANKKLGNEALATQLEQITNEERQKIAQEKMGDSMQDLVKVIRPISDAFTSMNTALAQMTSLVSSIGRGFAYISGLKIVQFLMGGGIKEAAKKVTDLSVTAGAKETAKNAAEAGGKGLTKDVIAKAGLTEATKGTSGTVAAKMLTSGASESAGSGLLSGLAGGVKNLAGSWMSPGATLMKGLGEMGVGGFLKKAGGMGIINLLVESFFADSDIKDIIAANVGKPKEEIAKPIGTRVSEGIGSVVGGALLGTLLSPLPGGTILGGMLGSYGGKLLGGWLGKDSVGVGNFILDSLYKKEMKAAQIQGLATGGVVQTTGIAQVDAGEFYAGMNSADTIKAIYENSKNKTVVQDNNSSIQILQDLVSETRRQNDYLQALVRKDTSLSIDGQHLAGAVAKNVITSYGNLLNPSSTTYR